MSPAELDPDVLATIRALEGGRVEFIVVGDAADVVHGTRRGGYVDALAIVPSGFARNVDRLIRTMKDLSADLRVPGESQTLPVDLSQLREVGRCLLATDLADVVIDFEPPGTAGYPDLYADARRAQLAGGMAPYVASVEDLERIENATRSATPRAFPTASPAHARGRAPVRHR
jgi:hypothetical protein